MQYFVGTKEQFIVFVNVEKFMLNLIIFVSNKTNTVVIVSKYYQTRSSIILFLNPNG
jgi:hypothetical protein